MLKTGSVFVFLYGGNIPFVVSLCFASQRSPTVCPHCAGSISTIGLRSFLLQVSGVSSRLSFCCTSLVSGFIIPKGRVHNNIHIIFPYSTDKLDRFYNTFQSIQFIFVRQSFFRRASPPLQLSTKLIVFKGIVFGKIGEPFLRLLHDA